MVRVRRSIAAAVGVFCVRIEIGLQRDEFLRELLHRLHVSPLPTEVRSDALPPSVPPELLKSLPANAATQACPSRSLSAYAISTRICFLLSGRPARAVSGRAERAAEKADELALSPAPVLLMPCGIAKS